MKICVVTLVGLFNYGNRLQNYAVTRALEARGHEVATVGSSWRPPVEAAKRFLRGVIGRSVDPAASMSEARLDRFREFNSLIDVERLPRLGRELDERFDKFVVGSDQVWNPNYLYDERGYFLSFASPEKRVALSASFGVDRIPEDRARGFREGLRGIPSISVREEEGAVIVRELAGRVAPVLIDPTMAVDASEWRPLERADCTPGGEYVFSYVLGKSEEAERVLSDLGSRGGRHRQDDRPGRRRGAQRGPPRVPLAHRQCLPRRYELLPRLCLLHAVWKAALYRPKGRRERHELAPRHPCGEVRPERGGAALRGSGRPLRR